MFHRDWRKVEGVEEGNPRGKRRELYWRFIQKLSLKSSYNINDYVKMKEWQIMIKNRDKLSRTD